MSDRPRSDLTLMRKLIDSSLDEGYLGLAREMVRVFDVWRDAVGDYNAAKAQPESIKNGVLTVMVESPVWIDRLGYLRAEFLERINLALGAPVVREIVFRVGLPPNLSRKPAGPAGTPVDDTPPVLDSPALLKAVSHITDPDLRQRLAALLARQKTLRSK